MMRQNNTQLPALSINVLREKENYKQMSIEYDQ